MVELERPAPRPSFVERVLGWWQFVGTGRLVSIAASVVVVAAGSWWLLRTPAPPVESRIPLATGVTAPSAPTVVAGSSPPATVAGEGTPGPGAVGSTTTALPSSTIVVQAAGAVMAPGVYTLPIGARVHELIAAAGGPAPLADLDALALASVMVDGQRVDVPVLGDGAPPMAAPEPTSAAPAASGVASVSGPVDLNSATAAQLDALPGVGPATAAAIVAWREQNGPFSAVDDLLDVRGIGPAKLDAIRSMVTA